MPDQLTALDATFLELEEADETAHMHVGGTMVFDPLPGVRRTRRRWIGLDDAARADPRYRGYAEALDALRAAGLA